MNILKGILAVVDKRIGNIGLLIPLDNEKLAEKLEIGTGIRVKLVVLSMLISDTSNVVRTKSFELK